MKVKKLILSFSVLNEWRRCPRKFMHRYVQSLVPKTEGERGALDFGSSVHKYFEKVLGGATHEESLAEAKTSLAADGFRSQVHLDGLIAAYREKYPSEDFEVIATEKEFEVVLPFADCQVLWRAHADAVIKFKDGRLAILEHKTSSSNLLFGWMPRMLPNAQAVGYVWAAQSSGLALDSILFNAMSTDQKLLNPDYAPKKRTGEIGERPLLFLRHELNIEPWMVQEWLRDVTRDVRKIIADIESGSFTQNAPDACTVFNRPCEFRDICLTWPTARDTMIESAFKLEPWKGFEVEYDA
jgi:hypothetical protein